MNYCHFVSCNSSDGSLDLVLVVVVGMGPLTMTFCSTCRIVQLAALETILMWVEMHNYIYVYDSILTNSVLKVSLLKF